MTRKFPTRGKAIAGSTDRDSGLSVAVRRSRSLNFSDLEVGSIAVSSPVIRFDEVPPSPSFDSPTNSISDLLLDSDISSSIASAPPSARGASKGSRLSQQRQISHQWHAWQQLPTPEIVGQTSPEPDYNWSASPSKIAIDLFELSGSDEVLTFHDVEKQFERQILGQDLTFRFSINYRCLPGECIRVVGSAEPLGDWQAQHAPVMTWLPGDEWVLELTFPLTPRPTLERGSHSSPTRSNPVSSPTKSALDGSTVLAQFEYKYCVTSAPAREYQHLRWENGSNRSFTITSKRAEGTRHFKLSDSWQE